jgi:hypothetical protein
MGLDLKYTDTPNHEIACPKCGGSYLHHSLITAFWREGEDAHHGLRVQSGRPGETRQSDDIETSAMTATAMAANPSSRRDGLEIRFWCENCNALPRLLLSQHKGNTELQWATPIEVSPKET